MPRWTSPSRGAGNSDIEYTRLHSRWPNERTITNTISMVLDSQYSPFFIVGAPRSGTTLLRLMLDAHSRLCIPPESHFIPELVKQLKHDWTPEEFWTAISKHPRFVEWNLTLEAVRDKVCCARANWGDVFDVVYREYAQRAGKLRWGDKTPGYVRHIRLLDGIFHDARIIHLIRDGRDVACSLRSVPWYDGTIADCARYWRRLVEKGRRDGQRLDKKRYLEVRYEELVNDPELILGDVCHFIGEQFEPQMLRYYSRTEDLIPQHRMAWHEKTKRAVDDTSVERWRRDLDAADLMEFEAYAGRSLQRFGYQRAIKWSIKVAGTRFRRRLERAKTSLVASVVRGHKG